jgi:CheY-like chemotaxis protein
LMAISGYCELLELQDQLGETQLALLKNIRKSTDKGSSLTHQLLALSRRQVLEPKIINLSQFISNMEPMLKRLLGEEIALDYRPGKDTGNVKIDPAQMEQVILNLVVNARDAMSTGGTLRIETSVTDLDEHFVSSHLGSHAGRHVKLTFSDTGTGMSDGTISHIFEPFFTTKEKGKGTGLGLSIIYSVVRQSGGYITVKSALMKGTTFDLYLPQISEPASRSGSFKRNRATGTETILLVDDNDSVRESVAAMLQLSGYQVLSASSGPEALELSRNHSNAIHLLISDVAMPSMNGWQLAKRLNTDRPNLKILLMSGYAEQLRNPEVRLKFEFLEKPISMEVLLTRIRQILDRSEE